MGVCIRGNSKKKQRSRVHLGLVLASGIKHYTCTKQADATFDFELVSIHLDAEETYENYPALKSHLSKQDDGRLGRDVSQSLHDVRGSSGLQSHTELSRSLCTANTPGGESTPARDVLKDLENPAAYMEKVGQPFLTVPLAFISKGQHVEPCLSDLQYYQRDRKFCMNLMLKSLKTSDQSWPVSGVYAEDLKKRASWSYGSAFREEKPLKFHIAFTYYYPPGNVEAIATTLQDRLLSQVVVATETHTDMYGHEATVEILANGVRSLLWHVLLY